MTNNDRIAEIRARCEAATAEIKANQAEEMTWRYSEDVAYLLEQLKKTEATRVTLRKEVVRLAWESVRRDTTMAKLEAEVKAATEARRWVPVEERLPEKHGSYLCAFDEGLIGVFDWGGPYSLWDDVTHWMPLPAAPDEKEE